MQARDEFDELGCVRIVKIRPVVGRLERCGALALGGEVDDDLRRITAVQYVADDEIGIRPDSEGSIGILGAEGPLDAAEVGAAVAEDGMAGGEGEPDEVKREAAGAAEDADVH